MWIDAASWLSGSIGLNSIQRSTTPAYCGPPTITTFVAPVDRTASSSSCMPAAVYETPGHVPPFLTHVHAAVVFRLLSGNGSLNRSKTTERLSLKVCATAAQNVGEWSRSG